MRQTQAHTHNRSFSPSDAFRNSYVVRDKFMRPLLDAIRPRNCDVKKNYATAIDVCWKPLQVCVSASCTAAPNAR